MEKISKAISYIYHPLIIPSLGMLVLFNSGTYLSYLPFDVKKWILVIVFLSTYVVPLAFIPFFLYQQIINNIQMESRRERYLPLAVSLILFIFCYYLIRRISIPHLYHSFLLSSLISVFVTILITIKYKISIHMVGAGGLTALIAFLAFYLRVDLQFYLGVALVLGGLTGTARIILKAHTPDEVYTGFLTGFAVVLLTLILA
ncbi:PAP2 family protein [Bacteroidota bacterium]